MQAYIYLEVYSIFIQKLLLSSSGFLTRIFRTADILNLQTIYLKSCVGNISSRLQLACMVVVAADQTVDMELPIYGYGIYSFPRKTNTVYTHQGPFKG